LAVIILLAVSSFDLLCARVIKPSVKRFRPSHELEDARLLVGKGGKYGFPSNHAANIAAAMTLLILFY
jgi:undecaprenyl-diphosphatase